MRNRQFVFAPKIEYKLVAERGEPHLLAISYVVRSVGLARYFNGCPSYWRATPRPYSLLCPLPCARRDSNPRPSAYPDVLKILFP
jgi:hypothetical protein